MRIGTALYKPLFDRAHTIQVGLTEEGAIMLNFIFDDTEVMSPVSEEDYQSLRDDLHPTLPPLEEILKLRKKGDESL